MADQVEVVPWGTICAKLRSEFSDLGPVLDSLDRFRDDEVWRLSLPYGTMIINKGRFDWSLLGADAEHRLGYDAAPIPLGLIVSKVVELYEPAPKPQHHRMIPQYLIQPGEFFGLFETLLGAEEQESVFGTAGGTTLYALPAIGDAGGVQNFGNKVGWSCPKNLLERVKQWDKSDVAFGEFFRRALIAAKATWRAEIILFPKRFLDQMLSNPEAKIAILEVTLAQMKVARDRSESTTAMLLKQGRGVPGDLFAARQIAANMRPGFAPVLGTDGDELILPARELLPLLYDEIHGLFSAWNDSKANVTGQKAEAETEIGATFDFFPALFRPSLAGETAYYFLKRPYGPSIDGQNTKQRLTNLIADLADETNADFKGADPGEFEAMMRGQYLAAGSPDTRKVKLGRSQFIESGVVQIVKRKRPGAR